MGNITQGNISFTVNVGENAGGFATGIGEWRPKKDGQYGMYKLKES